MTAEIVSSAPQRTSNAKQPKRLPRGLILAVATLLALGNGVIYMWSIFNKPLMDAFGYSPSGVALAYSLFMLMSCVGSFLAGWLQNRMQLRFVVLGGGLCFGLGWALSGFADTLPLLYLFFGGLGGLGNGLTYNTIVSVATKWFPDKRGFANGICTGAMGMGPVIFAPFGNFLIESLDVLMAFRVVGLMWLVLYVAFSWLLTAPPDGWAPKGWNPEQAKSASVSSGRNFATKQMLKQPLFYVLFLLLMVAVTSGQMVNGHASNLGQELAQLTSAQAALMVSLLGVGSVLGRLGFGALSDKLGRYVTMIVILGLNAAIMLLALGNAHTFVTFMVCMMLAGACFGGTMSVMPSIVGDVFGARFFGQNWAFVYAGYTVASFVGPMVAANATETAGTFGPALIVAGVLALVGIALTLLARSMAKRLAS